MIKPSQSDSIKKPFSRKRRRALRFDPFANERGEVPPRDPSPMPKPTTIAYASERELRARRRALIAKRAEDIAQRIIARVCKRDMAVVKEERPSSAWLARQTVIDHDPELAFIREGDEPSWEETGGALPPFVKPPAPAAPKASEAKTVHLPVLKEPKPRRRLETENMKMQLAALGVRPSRYVRVRGHLVEHVNQEDRALVESTERPTDRKECRPGAPTRWWDELCPFFACQHHLGISVNEESGSITVLEGIDDRRPTCALDVADDGWHTFTEVGELLDVVRERVRQIEEKALAKLKREERRRAVHGAGE